MKAVFDKWNSISLILRILAGLVVGTILALTVPGVPIVALLGQLFVSALKAIAPVLVFVLVISALANAAAASGMRTIIGLYLLSTAVAAFVAAAVSLIFPLTLRLGDGVDNSAPSQVGEVLSNLILGVVSNPIGSLANANYLGILAWAVVLGLALRQAQDGTKTVLSNLADAVATVVRWVIAFAPFGVMGLVFDAVSSSGLAIFEDYGRLLILLVGCMLIIALIVNPLIVFLILRRNPYPLVWRCLKESGLTAFFTRSSAANIPVNLELCRRLGLTKDTYAMSIPLGATVNMAGASVTITVMALAAAHTAGIQVDLLTAVLLSLLATVSACGASGVAGGSLLLIPLACSLFGLNQDIAMQVVGIGFIIGVVQDSCETALNSSSDVLFTATAEYRARRRRGEAYVPGELVLR